MERALKKLSYYNCSDGYICLNENEITDKVLFELQEKIESLINPKRLTLYYNYTLTTIPNFNLSTLTHLDVSACNLSTVPNLDNLVSLEHLDLGYNRLKTIPNFDLPNLICLDVGLNELTCVSHLTKLPKLRVLCVNHNPLSWDETMPLLVYKSNPSVDKFILSVSKNQLDNIHYYIERDLEHIYLTGDDGGVKDIAKEIQEQNKDNKIPSYQKSVQF